ncbi:MAG: hypothetical protein ABSF22_14975 [Bryobacteraceae bacterium]
MTDPAPRLLTRWTLSAAALLFSLNAYICRELFRVEYTNYWLSIEGAYIGISRYILDHWHDFMWFPLWYGGIPFQNAYPPLLHMLVAADAWLFHVSPARAHHSVTAVFYCLGPVALFFLVYALSSRFDLSLAAGLLFSLTSPSAILLHEIRQYMDTIRGARRLHTLIVDGDGPHVSVITLLFFAILALHLAIDRGTAIWAWIAILAFGAVVLTNWLGTFSLALATICYLLARSRSDRRYLRMLGISAGIGAIAYCLIAPWIPPSTVRDVQRNAQFVIGDYAMGARQYKYWAVVLVGFVLLWWLLSRCRVSLCMQFASYFFYLTAALTMLYDYRGVYLVPQPHRYHLELEAAVAILLACGLGPILIRWAGKYQIWLVAILVIAGISQVRIYRRYARTKLGAADVHQALEYQAATWLDSNLPNQRVFATGSVQFWLNAFSRNSQVGGGFGQGVSNPEIPIIHYGIPYTEHDGERTAMWLRLLGVQAVVTSGPAGRDAYKEAWRDPSKFNGVLPELWRDGDDAIYGVPQRSTSLAHVIPPAALVLRSPINVADVEPVAKLAAALEAPSLPEAEFTWRGQGSARISAVLKPDQLLFVQESYHPGWVALVNGQPRPIGQDGLGFLIIEPHCNGRCDVELSFDGGAEMHHANILRMLGILAAVLWMGLSVNMSRRNRHTNVE